MIKKIIKWFSDHSDKGFFYKTEDGREIFYPWAYPGESFYVDKKQKKQLHILLLFLLALFLSQMLLGDLVENSDIWMMIDRLMFFLYGPVYILGVFIIKGSSNLYVLPKEDRQLKKYVYVWSFLFIFMALCTVPGIPDGISSLSFPHIVVAVIGIPSAIFFVYFLFKIQKTRGYFFYKE